MLPERKESYLPGKIRKKKKEKNVCIMKEQFADALQVLKKVGSTELCWQISGLLDSKRLHQVACTNHNVTDT